MSWTDERIAQLKKMWKEGKSAADIAKFLAKGVTRNAVIGKAHRMGLSGRPSPIKKAPPAPKKTVAKKEIKKAAPVAPLKKAAAPVVSGVRHNPLTRELAEPRKFEKEAIPPGGGVALIDLTERMCKWPIGDPKEDDFTFCGRHGVPVFQPQPPTARRRARRKRSRGGRSGGRR